MRITRRQKSQKMHFQEFWDSWAQNKTSDISKNALSGGIIDFLFALVLVPWRLDAGILGTLFFMMFVSFGGPEGGGVPPPGALFWVKLWRQTGRRQKGCFGCAF